MQSATRAKTSIVAQVAKFFNFIGKKDPLAQYQLKIDEATEEIREATNTLPSLKGHIARLERELNSINDNIRVFDAKVNAAIKNNDDALATTLDGTLQRYEANKDSIQNQINTFKKNYDLAIKRIKNAQETIMKAKDESRRLGYELEMSEANKKAAEIAVSFSNVGDNALSDTQEIKSEIQRRIDENNAFSDVTADLGIDDSKEKADEISAMSIKSQERLAARKASIKQ